MYTEYTHLFMECMALIQVTTLIAHKIQQIFSELAKSKQRFKIRSLIVSHAMFPGCFVGIHNPKHVGKPEAGHFRYEMFCAFLL